MSRIYALYLQIHATWPRKPKGKLNKSEMFLYILYSYFAPQLQNVHNCIHMYRKRNICLHVFLACVQSRLYIVGEVCDMPPRKSNFRGGMSHTSHKIMGFVHTYTRIACKQNICFISADSCNLAKKAQRKFK